jgi:hypothetical protein
MTVVDRMRARSFAAFRLAETKEKPPQPAHFSMETQQTATLSIGHSPCVGGRVPMLALPAGIDLRYAGIESERAGSPGMTLLNKTAWEIGAGLTTVAAMTGLATWIIFRKRPTAEELELARRQFLVQCGRLVDGMLLDVCEVKTEDGRTLNMLFFSYRIGGVDYECSQDITQLREVVDATQIRAGFPCTVRYHQANPHNSIVVAEGWSGLRKGLPQLRGFDDPDPIHAERLNQGRS